MKKVFYALIFAILILMPMGVLADASFSLDCPANVKKGVSFSCSLKLSSIGSTETLNEIAANGTGDTKFSGTDTINANSLNLTSAGNIGTITLTSGDVAGTGKVTVNITTATDGSDPIVITNPTVTDDVKVLDNDNTIKNIKIDGTTNTTCSTGSTSCTLTGIKKSSMVIDMESATTAIISGNGTVNLKCGTNNHKITITAEDGTAKSYSFSINRVCDKTTTLKGITVSKGTLNPTFSASTKSYKVEVTSDVDKITISGTKAVSSQTITGEVKDKALVYGDNKFTLTVKAEDASTTSYVIVVNRKDDRSENNLLKSITLSDGKINPVFDKDTVEYRAKVLFEVEKVKVVAEAEDEKAKIEYVDNEKALKVGDNVILIKVKSENQKEKVYKVIIEKLAEGEVIGDNPNLTNISVKGYELGFNYNKNSYNLEIEKESTLDIEVVPEEPTSTYEITGNKNLKDGSIITIKVTSQDGTTKEYTINIEKTNILLYVIIASVVLAIAIALIVYLLIKNKKDKDSLTTTKVKKQLKQDDEILARVQHQLNEIEKPASNINDSLTAPVTIAPVEESIMEKPRIEESRIEEPNIPQYAQQTVIQTQEATVVDEEPKSEATRVCSICGHRVSVTLKNCPYCKRSF